jgi:hypothetical protein
VLVQSIQASHGTMPDATPAAPQTEPSSLAPVTRVLRMIDHEPGIPHDLNSLAATARLSPYHFLGVFEGLTGTRRTNICCASACGAPPSACAGSRRELWKSLSTADSATCRTSIAPSARSSASARVLIARQDRSPRRRHAAWPAMKPFRR